MKNPNYAEQLVQLMLGRNERPEYIMSYLARTIAEFQQDAEEGRLTAENFLEQLDRNCQVTQQLFNRAR